MWHDDGAKQCCGHEAPRIYVDRRNGLSCLSAQRPRKAGIGRGWGPQLARGAAICPGLPHRQDEPGHGRKPYNSGVFSGAPEEMNELQFVPEFGRVLLLSPGTLRSVTSRSCGMQSVHRIVGMSVHSLVTTRPGEFPQKGDA